MATTHQQVCAVTNYTLEYFQQWHRASTGVFDIAAAQLLLAAGCGPARVHSCDQTLRHISFTTVKEHFFASRVLLRALALLRAGELRTLRAADPTVLAFILSAAVEQSRQEAISGAAQGPDAVGASPGALVSLRAIEWSGAASRPDVAFALIGPYAANLVELQCPLRQQCDAADNLLACCIRLESLTYALHYAPSAWLHLSQLHTLRGVDLAVVSMSAIAAALPRLHTLSVFAFRAEAKAAVAGFFDDLLPRLQVLEYLGLWPRNLHSEEAASPCAPLPLPHLRTLTLRGFGTHPPPWTWFMGARPLEL
jgi:hypothetical protein